jgi:hypothetical protein
MSKARSAGKARVILLFNRDRVALLSGALFSTLVAVLCVFYADVSTPELIVRAIATFAVAYALTFLLMWRIQTVAAPELKRPRPPEEEPEAAQSAHGAPPGGAPGDKQS